MTHEDIIISISPSRKIGDYISVAVANGWTREKTVSELYDLYRRTGNEVSWDELWNLYNRYMEGNV